MLASDWLNVNYIGDIIGIIRNTVEEVIEFMHGVGSLHYAAEDGTRISCLSLSRPDVSARALYVTHENLKFHECFYFIVVLGLGYYIWYGGCSTF